MNKDANMSSSKLKGNMVRLNFRLRGLDQHVNNILDKYITMNADDIRLYLECIQRLIETITNENTIDTIFENTIECLYEAAVVATMVLTEKNELHERTLITTEVQFPDIFFTYIEEALGWILKVLKKIDFHNYTKLKVRVQRILFDFLIHDPKNVNVRNEGKILSLISYQSEWSNGIGERIKQIYNQSSKKDASKRVILLLLTNVEHLRYDFTVVANRATIMNELIEWANFTLKISDEDISLQMISFTIGSMMACKWDPTLPQDQPTREMFKRLIETTFKLVKSNKYEPMYLDIAARSVSLLNISLFDSYWKKLSALIAEHVKKQASPETFKSLALIVKLFCGNFINGEQLMRFITEIIYEKNKPYVLKQKFESKEDFIRDFFVSFSEVEPNIVCNYINGLQKLVTQSNELGPRTQYMLEIMSNIKTNDDALTKSLLAPIESKLELYLNIATPPGIIKSSLPLIVPMWTLIPRSRPGISQSVQNLIAHLDPTVQTACFRVFVEMMSKAPAADFPVNVAFNMPSAIFRQLSPNLPTNMFLTQGKMLLDFLVAITNIFHNKPGETYVEWETLVSKLDIALFPFLFSTEPLVIRLVRNIYSTIAPEVTFYCVATWLSNNRGRSLFNTLKSAVTTRPDWFVVITNKTINFWRILASKSTLDVDFCVNLATALFTMITPEAENLPIFFMDVLDMMLKHIDFKRLEKPFSNLTPLVWDKFFHEFNNFYGKNIDEQRLLCLQIQMLFCSNRHFINFNVEERESFYTTLKNYVISKRARFEREIPFEIISLQICSTIIRVDKTILPKLCEEIGGESELLKKMMTRINPKEIFVVNANRIFAHLDFFAAVLSQIKVNSNDVSLVLSYLLTIADKSIEYSELLDVIADCINQMFTMNDESRTLIIHTSISFKNTLLNEIGKAIMLNAKSEQAITDRKQLTDELVLATSLFSSSSSVSHIVGLNLAKSALEKLAKGDEEYTSTFENPLFSYNPHCEEMVWKLIDKYLGDEEMEEFITLLSNISSNIPRRSQQPVVTMKALEFFNEPKLEHFTSIYSYLASNDFSDFNQFVPILNHCDQLFANQIENIEDILNILMKSAGTSQSHLNATVYMFHSAFQSHPEEVSDFIKQKFTFLDHLNNPQTWQRIHEEINSFARGTAILSYILARNNDKELTKKLFGNYAPQLLLYALHIFELKEFRMSLFPPLLLSLLHSFSPSRQLLIFRNNNALDLSPAQCQFANDIIEEFDPESAKEFRRIIIPSRADGQEMNLNFVHAISPRFGAHDIAMLLSVVAEYATKDNVGTVLRFLPALVNALPSVAPPKTIAYFIMFMISFMFDNGDPRIILSFAENLPVLSELLEKYDKKGEVSKEFTDLLNESGGSDVILSVVLEPLALADKLTGPLYPACLDFLININGYISSNDERNISTVDAIIIILDSLWNISGVKSRLYKARKTGWMNGCQSINDLVSFITAALQDKEDMKCVCQFLLRLTSNMVIQDDKFRLNTVNLFSRFVEDIEIIASMENVGEFLLVSSVCSDEVISLKYAGLLGQLINQERKISKKSRDIISIMGPTLVHNDEESMTIVRSISPDFYPALSVVARPPVLSSFIDKLVFN
ncbi:hypothetical protein TVAG_431560 [Trichomonas vaginalis G3]|uniref:Uncharacterized protein n=2 Tax=Trichomonas vaginalis (strain ATCC PRA-98 / G3) TaxID=412133 RepID=A2G666_TRIV3|nr:hypothetical protein TVAGG3_0171450 [Trichomonas vaginalis G3]EAX87346.1 hypothetical protein TVAG_431560 [Trichomonas vaginalis G3]KAI5548611.1 hypothetical protein TVAGG3_0171450 [Trichomonas vaginalis G3]|eukprot:XP_001300276.1 hypothetical protein [Trichomonas vaginalis G3]